MSKIYSKQTWQNNERLDADKLNNLERGLFSATKDIDNIPTITVDDELSDTSINPVQNKVIQSVLDKKSDIIQVSKMPPEVGSGAGKIVQYIGETTSEYTKGYFYQYVTVGAISRWSKLLVCSDDSKLNKPDSNGGLVFINSQDNVTIRPVATPTYTGKNFVASVEYVDDIASDKVDKVDGKQLSTNDFTNQYKTDIDTLNAKSADWITKTVSDLTNYYNKTDVDSKVSAIPKFAIEVVSSLPMTDISITTVYLLKTSETETGNLYTEYIYVNNTWEELGTQTVDLTGYATEQWVENKGYLTEHQSLSAYRTSADQDKIDNEIKDTISQATAQATANKGNIQELQLTKQDTITDLATIRSNASSGASKISCTEATVAGYGFTKNTGTYNKPTGGIPKSDLASDVQTSLGKADSALQSVPNTYALKTEIPTKTSQLTNDSGFITAHQDISNKLDKPTTITDSVVIVGYNPNTTESTGFELDSAVLTDSTTYIPTSIVVKDAISHRELTANKVTSISSASTDTQYPSAKAVYDFVVDYINSLDATNTKY